MNKVWEIGRLTKEPEIRYTSKKNGNGEEESTVTASYTLAVARGYRHEDGQNDADFFRCVAFGKNAEFAEKYLHKGTKIAISGHLHSGSYTNKDGVKGTITDESLPILYSITGFSNSAATSRII